MKFITRVEELQYKKEHENQKLRESTILYMGWGVAIIHYVIEKVDCSARLAAH